MKKDFFLQAHIKCCWICDMTRQMMNDCHCLSQRTEFVDFVEIKFWTIWELMFYMLPWEWSRTGYSKAFISFFYSSELWSLYLNWKLSKHGRHITAWTKKVPRASSIYLKIIHENIWDRNFPPFTYWSKFTHYDNANGWYLLYFTSTHELLINILHHHNV